MPFGNPAIDPEPTNAGAPQTSWGYESQEQQISPDQVLGFLEGIIAQSRESFTQQSQVPMNQSIQNAPPPAPAPMPNVQQDVNTEYTGGSIYGFPGWIALYVPETDSFMSSVWNSVVFIGKDWKVPGVAFAIGLFLWLYRRTLKASWKTLTKTKNKGPKLLPSFG